MTDQELLDSFVKFLNDEPFVTARELGDKFGVTSQKASGILRKLENREFCASKKVKAGINEVKCYFKLRI